MKKEVFQHFRRQLELLPQPRFQVLQLSEYSLSLLSFVQVMGDSATREVLETRAFVRCNNKMGGDFTVKY
jgi:hypothetical protein